MRILVTGGAGFIGSHLSERLLAGGHNVRVLDNLSTGKRKNLTPHAAVEFLEGDIRDRTTVCDAVAGCDAIVHLAAVASVQASADDPLGIHDTNFGGTLNLLEAARRSGVGRFLYASSAAVYGDVAPLPVTEDALLKPLSPYASDKLAGEHYLDFYCRKFGLSGTAFRFFNIYGPRQDPTSPYSGVISIFVERACQQRPVTIFGDGAQTRDFVYVSDLADILVAALPDQRLAGQVINVGRGLECSLLDVLHELEQLLGYTIERHHAPSRIGDIQRSRADVSRLKRLLGLVPATPIAEGLNKLLSSLEGGQRSDRASRYRTAPVSPASHVSP